MVSAEELYSMKVFGSIRDRMSEPELFLAYVNASPRLYEILKEWDAQIAAEKAAPIHAQSIPGYYLKDEVGIKAVYISETEFLSAGSLVSVLGHEGGHFINYERDIADYAAALTASDPLRALANVCLLSEGRAVQNNLTIADQIFQNTGKTISILGERASNSPVNYNSLRMLVQTNNPYLMEASDYADATSYLLGQYIRTGINSFDGRTYDAFCDSVARDKLNGAGLPSPGPISYLDQLGITEYSVGVTVTVH
ncbi:MAG: hypothetical protein K2X44_00810 [Magnetospirillum sp.]|nr:hypothetical protein [Magnetospirillum sp.]